LAYFWLPFENGGVWVNFEVPESTRVPSGGFAPEDSACISVIYFLDPVDEGDQPFRGTLPYGVPNPFSVQSLTQSLGKPHKKWQTESTLFRFIKPNPKFPTRYYYCFPVKPNRELVAMFVDERPYSLEVRPFGSLSA
jgi:hypothetical protein